MTIPRAHRRFTRAYLFAATAFLLAGCSTLRQEFDQQQVPAGSADVVFVADGAGDYRRCSHALKQACAESDLPLLVETFVWSHGHRRIAVDQFDRDHARSQGHRLAELVMERRRAHPEGKIYLVGHSAGSRVVVNAAEELPDGSIQRIILLSPALPAAYDLRPALRHAVDGIDVHYSSHDLWELGTVVRVLTMFLGEFGPVAGVQGFEPIIFSPEDCACYRKLRQHPWDPSVREATGHDGGHYGCYQQGYLRHYVLPSMSLLPSFPI